MTSTTRANVSEAPGAEGAVGASTPTLFTPLRMLGYGAVLTALAFFQAGGRMLPDTKFDLVTDPWGFLARGLHLWDAGQAFGQVPNQQYGYAWPMGPFFGLGELLNLPAWVVQRLWWALLLCLGFYGVLTLLRSLRVGSPAAQLIAAFAYVLAPRVITLIGTSSAELWPMALAPWVLVPLVRGARKGSPVRAAGLSALAVACAGGVNAVAVAATLPLGLIWLLTRERGQRRTKMLVWWPVLTVLTTLWWSAPLLIMGQYSAPFLDYIENATVTTVPTDLTNTLTGFNNWVAHLGGVDVAAAYQTLTTPYVLIQFILVVAIGLAGITLRSNPHRRFLLLGLLSGLVLVGLGYAGPLAGYFADSRQAALDGALAPLRNVHKFDVVLRLPLVIGLAAGLTALAAKVRAEQSKQPLYVLRGVVVVMLAMLVLPWVRFGIAPGGAAREVPDHWSQAADYLAEHDDNSVTLELPATGFGVYGWGNVRDDVMQGLARSRWAVRNVIPLAQPGNVVMLDAVTKEVEAGRPSRTLARFLAAQGVGRVLVRNDVSQWDTGAPDPVALRSVLRSSPGFRLERAFGAVEGDVASYLAKDEVTRVVSREGRDTRLPALELYAVDGTTATATVSTSIPILAGDPGVAMSPGLTSASPALLPEDADSLTPFQSAGLVSGQLLTDSNRRRETAFAAVRRNQSATMGAEDEFKLAGKEHTHRLAEDAERWQTTAVWRGDVRDVTARTSQGFANSVPPLDPGRHPGAAFDGDPHTSWQSASYLPGDGQWWEVQFARPQDLDYVKVSVADDSTAIKTLTITDGTHSRTVPAPQRGESESYVLRWEAAAKLRITPHTYEREAASPVALSEVSLTGITGDRALVLPAPAPGQPVDTISLNRDPGAQACIETRETFSCEPWLATNGEDGDSLQRILTLDEARDYTVSATASLRQNAALTDALLRPTGVSLTAGASASVGLAGSALALVDDDPGTTWRANEQVPTIELTLPEPTRITSIELPVSDAAPVSGAALVRVKSGTKVLDLAVDEKGGITIPGWRTDELSLTILETTPAFPSYGEGLVPLQAGASALTVNGSPIIPAAQRAVEATCGQGPDLRIGASTVETSLRATWRELMRGETVDLDVCGPDSLELGSGVSTVSVAPTTLVRPETVTLSAEPARAPALTPVELVFDDTHQPVRTEVEDAEGPQILTVAQNLNPGWRATLDGQELAPVRVDGWKQAWVVPAGVGGTVSFDYIPQPLLSALMLVGAGAALLVLLGLAASWLWTRRRSPVALPRVGTAPAGTLDIAVVLFALAALGGTFALICGLAGAGVLVVLRRRRMQFSGWGAVAACCYLIASLAMVWAPLRDLSLSMEWRQAWMMLGLGALAAAVLSLVLERRPPPARQTTGHDQG